MAYVSELIGAEKSPEAASVRKLDEMIQQVYQRYEYTGTDIAGFLQEDSFLNIDWEKIRYLRIIGDAKDAPLRRFNTARISQGCYLNADGSWVLVILSDTYSLIDCINNCCEQLESLWIQNTWMHMWNVKPLPALQDLRLADNPVLENIGPATSLPKLEQLDILNCSRLIAHPSLWKHNNLKELTITADDSVYTLPGLENMTQLTRLTLWGCTHLTELPEIGSLTQLTELELSACINLSSLSGLENLKNLTKLNLYACSSIPSIPGLENLTQLSALNLSGCDSISALPGLENLTQLTELRLSGCSGITALPGLENLTHLTVLVLYACSNLHQFPEGLRHCRNLHFLELSYLHLDDLPDWLPEIADSISTKQRVDPGKNKAAVFLQSTTIEEIKDMAIFDQSYEMVVDWFESRRLGRTRPLNEIKVVFLGDGEAGKSLTVSRLMNHGGPPVDYTDISTPGIAIKHQEYLVNSRQFKVHYWDFGGQEILHSMHRIFLTGRTMYVILLNARDDTQSDRARYWLQNIKSFAPDAPVLLVLNKIDQNPKASIDERTLRARYTNLTRIVRLSALKFSQDEFNNTFTNVLLQEIQNTGYLDTQWPESWIQVKRELESMDTHYILGNEYQSICQQYRANDVHRELLHWFNDLGVSFCFCGEADYTLKKHVILRPDWITNALYIILFNECANARNGYIPHESIYNLLDRASIDSTIQCTLPGAKYDRPGDIEYVLGVMRKFQLSLDLKNGHEFIPMLCQENSMVDIRDYESDTDLLEFAMNFEYLPDNLLHRFMVERYTELDITHVWRTGARFQFKELGFSAIVVIDGNTLRFFIRHTIFSNRPNTYLTMLKATADRIVSKMGLTAPTNQLIYKLDGKQDTFDFDTLKAMQEDNETHVYSITWRRKIPIENILNQSAPEGLENQQKLLDAIKLSCQNIQGEPDYCLSKDGHGMEDKRNRRIRDDLSVQGFLIQDQTQRGSSESGKGIGELDFLLHNEKGELWTAIEALRISNGTKSTWNKHLDKLVGNYNFFGAPFLCLLTYVDANPRDFASIWDSYQQHIKEYNPGQHTYSQGSFYDLSDEHSPRFFKIAKCQYSYGSDPITVYHIFARIPIPGEYSNLPV